MASIGEADEVNRDDWKCLHIISMIQLLKEQIGRWKVNHAKAVIVTMQKLQSWWLTEVCFSKQTCLQWEMHFWLFMTEIFICTVSCTSETELYCYWQWQVLYWCDFVCEVVTDLVFATCIDSFWCLFKCQLIRESYWISILWKCNGNLKN